MLRIHAPPRARCNLDPQFSRLIYFKMSICGRYQDKHRELTLSLNDLISWSNQCGFHGQHQIHICIHLVTGYLLTSANWCLNIPKWFHWFSDCHEQLDKHEPGKLMTFVLKRRNCWIRGWTGCLLLPTINRCGKWCRKMQKRAQIIQMCISVESDRSSKNQILGMSWKSSSKFLVELFDVSISIQVRQL